MLCSGYLDLPASRGYRIGISARCVCVRLLVTSLLTPFLNSEWLRIERRNVPVGQNGQLQSLFRQLARLLPTLTNIIFVFDGQVTSGEVSDIPKDFVASFADMIRIFGFHVHLVSTTAKQQLVSFGLLLKNNTAL